VHARVGEDREHFAEQVADPSALSPFTRTTGRPTGTTMAPGRLSMADWITTGVWEATWAEAELATRNVKHGTRQVRSNSCSVTEGKCRLFLSPVPCKLLPSSFGALVP
jgi:hypothetical protein